MPQTYDNVPFSACWTEHHSTSITYTDSLLLSKSRPTIITMSGTPPSARKRPQCHSCGTLMAGHRRVNGRYVCPSDEDTSNNNTATTTPSPRRSARLNSHPREQQTPPLPPSTRPGPSNWDPPSRSRSAKREPTMSPAPTVMSEEYCKTEDESFYTENDFVGSPATPQQRTSKIGPTSSLRTFARSVRLSTPLASIFTAPRSGIEEVQQEAGRHGLYTGTVYKPRRIKEEESQRWVVMGRDPDAVDRLVDYQKKDVARQLELESRTTTPVPVLGMGAMVPPINVTCNGPSIWRTFVTFVPAGFVGAMILFYMFVYL
ncbi:hypothetical protein BDM02DRAFT_544805 [Thelephora ganbajun]|uniref:Uncharacterized protein n=1 Tax=Thelephora ganbajun TaxID=370292 RepID=A0ACB6ZPV6_THEGA|nr:hypothetical protein BDM02DRAFT_544805 [Thelephora ganbajun]